jgi:hypothetical protein
MVMGSPSVEFPDNPSQDNQREKRESPLVEPSCKLYEVKDFG